MPTTPPLLQSRPARPYIAIPSIVSMVQLPGTLLDLFAEARSWAREHGAQVVGAPFVRYRVVGAGASALSGEASGEFEVEAGVMLSTTSAQASSARAHADPRVREGVLPPGTYATIVHTGPYSGLRAAAAELLAWGEANGIAWHRLDESRAESWDAYVESYLTDAAAQPDAAHWQTEIAFLTKES